MTNYLRFACIMIFILPSYIECNGKNFETEFCIPKRKKNKLYEQLKKFLYREQSFKNPKLYISLIININTQ